MKRRVAVLLLLAHLLAPITAREAAFVPYTVHAPSQESVRVVLPEGQALDEALASQVVGHGGLTILTGVYMVADGMTRMARGGERGDLWEFALGAAEYLLGKATTVVGVVTGPATP